MKKELVTLKLKKYSAVQLFAKLDSGKLNAVETEVCIEILKNRKKDVSKYENKEVDELKPLKAKVDTFIESLITEKRNGVFTEVMKALGGSFSSDIEELFETVTKEQLEEALSFAKIKKVSTEKPANKPTEKPAADKPKATTSEKAVEGKNITIEKFTGNDDFVVGSKIEFDLNETKVGGEIARIYICHKTKKEKCRIKADNSKAYFKTVDKITLKK